MPELPEVETVCRGLDPVMTGRVIESVDVRCAGLRDPFPKNLKKILTHARILRITRRAKYILVHLDSDYILVLHLGMSGRISIQDPGYRPVKHDHFILHLNDGRVIVFHDPRRFGTIFLVGEHDWQDHKAFRDLGPEPLSNEFSGPVLAAALKGNALKGKKTAIKTAIMDQQVVVGVGNIYAAEALFLAGINPLRKSNTVQGDRAESLVLAIQKTLKRAIRAGGSSLRDYRKADGELGLFQHGFTVYAQEGKACPDCTCDIVKTKGIRRIVQGGRSTFYCPRKQK